MTRYSPLGCHRRYLDSPVNAKKRSEFGTIEELAIDRWFRKLYNKKQQAEAVKRLKSTGQL